MTTDPPDDAPEPGDEARPISTAELVQSEDGAHALVQKFWLHVAAGPDAGKTFGSKGDRVAIGTHESADVILHDSTVSRFHCEITPMRGLPIVRDLDSRNGTFVNAVPIREAYLRPGSILTIGRTRIRFEVGAQPVRVALSPRDRFGVAVGRSLAMRKVFAVLERVAASDVTVLVEGETGTGKELIAESIHSESARAEGPFIVVDCGAIPKDLLESELFGHEKGSFTGAVASRQGAFEAASGGTVFLDEIGELSPDLQPKLLRVLERREVKRVGAPRHATVDVRVVAATNRNLRAEINAGRFRSDLYYRLAVVEVRVPPLRERMDDVPMLLERILEGVGASDRPEAELLRTQDFLAEVLRHTWPGNVRELRNYVERCLALRESGSIPEAGPGDADPIVDPGVPLRPARERWVRAFERRYLEALLRQHGENVTTAARAAGVGRVQMYRLLWRHGLR
jgi:two-component system, NtrC family, response regulator GlrR